MYIKIYDETIISFRQRLENDINSQLLFNLETKFVQVFKMTLHLKNMRTDRTTSSQLAREQCSDGIEPFNSGFLLEHLLEMACHSISLHFHQLLLKLRLHASKNETSDINWIIKMLVISILLCSKSISSWFLWDGLIKDIFLPFLPKNNS